MIPQGNHLMLSYTSTNQHIVSKIVDILKEENIPVWFDRDGDMKTDIYERYLYEKLLFFSFELYIECVSYLALLME